VLDVLTLFHEVRRGKRGELFLIRLPDPAAKTNETAILSLTLDPVTGVYDVITAGPFGRRYVEKASLVWAGSRNTPTRPDGGADPSRAAQLATTTATPPRSGGDQTSLDVGEALSARKGLEPANSADAPSDTTGVGASPARQPDDDPEIEIFHALAGRGRIPAEDARAFLEADAELTRLAFLDDAAGEAALCVIGADP
jgi:hypothetical protein